MGRLSRLSACLALLAPAVFSAPLPDDCTQLLVGISGGWNSDAGTLQRFEREGHSWRPVSAPQRVLFGKNGLAWGVGVAGQEQPGLRKKEGDKRAPAGIFALGTIYTYQTALPEGSHGYPFHTVTPADAWIEDPALPGYNRHLAVDLHNPPAWFEKARMRQDDFAHAWKIEIRHNSDPPIPGMGSAIFFHIQRGPSRPSSGCTTMPESAILDIVRWLRVDGRPHYVLLPKAEYDRLWRKWRLPSPEKFAP